MNYGIKFLFGLICILFAILLSACQRQNQVCPPITGTPPPQPALVDLLALPVPESNSEPMMIEIGGKMRRVDKLVDYPLCNDNWSGTVYVNCDAQVAQSALDEEENPLFLKGCSLKIEPGTVVYVAAHNDTAYYKGCSCHTGEDPISGLSQ